MGEGMTAQEQMARAANWRVLDLPPLSRRALERIDSRLTVGKLLDGGERELRRWRGVGRGCIAEILAAVDAYAQRMGLASRARPFVEPCPGLTATGAPCRSYRSPGAGTCRWHRPLVITAICYHCDRRIERAIPMLDGATSRAKVVQKRMSLALPALREAGCQHVSGVSVRVSGEP